MNIKGIALATVVGFAAPTIAEISILSFSAPAMAVEDGSFTVESTTSRGVSFTNQNSSTKTFTFFATGGWTYNPNIGKHGAEGHPEHLRATANYKLPGYPEGALIVRRGNGQYQYIGTETTLRVGANETLYFMINDAKDGAAYADNQGSVKVEWVCQDCRAKF